MRVKLSLRLSNHRIEIRSSENAVIGAAAEPTQSRGNRAAAAADDGLMNLEAGDADRPASQSVGFSDVSNKSCCIKRRQKKDANGSEE